MLGLKLHDVNKVSHWFKTRHSMCNKLAMMVGWKLALALLKNFYEYDM